LAEFVAMNVWQLLWTVPLMLHGWPLQSQAVATWLSHPVMCVAAPRQVASARLRDRSRQPPTSRQSVTSCRRESRELPRVAGPRVPTTRPRCLRLSRHSSSNPQNCAVTLSNWGWDGR